MILLKHECPKTLLVNDLVVWIDLFSDVAMCVYGRLTLFSLAFGTLSLLLMPFGFLECLRKRVLLTLLLERFFELPEFIFWPHGCRGLLRD